MGLISPYVELFFMSHALNFPKLFSQNRLKPVRWPYDPPINVKKFKRLQKITTMSHYYKKKKNKPK